MRDAVGKEASGLDLEDVEDALLVTALRQPEGDVGAVGCRREPVERHLGAGEGARVDDRPAAVPDRGAHREDRPASRPAGDEPKPALPVLGRNGDERLVPPARRRLPERLERGQGADRLARGGVLALLPAPGLGRVLLEPAVGVVERDPADRVHSRYRHARRSMKLRSDFPRRVRRLDHVWIPMPDGVRLAARIWLPEDAEDDPVPAILEYIPYRKNDATAARDARDPPLLRRPRLRLGPGRHPRLGRLRGILEDEYLPQRAGRRRRGDRAGSPRQPWCTGAVGMIGKSWGGFNAPADRRATRRPSSQAVISVCSTDDRYADDVHYIGGCVLGADMLSWASTMLAYNARPPDPASSARRWREPWLERLERTPPFVEAWLSHQRRDEFWKQGSVCEDFARDPAAPSTWSAAGPTATRTRSCASSRATRARARG